MKNVYIIAEAGVNHGGDIKKARHLIQKATEAGVDAVKFQTFKASRLLVKSVPKAGYQKQTTDANESQYEMIRKLELTESDHRELIECARGQNIQLISSPFDEVSIDLLISLNIEVFKIPSGEITNLPYLRYIGRMGKQIIMSTGMTCLGEIESALSILLSEGSRREDITLLHCNTEYPTPMEDVNLKAMLTLRSAFPGIRVGYSDHTLGIEVPVAAVALGAEVIEKHFTLDKSEEGPDHRASLDPDQLKAMVKAIRNIEKALGNGIKEPTNSEKANIGIVRKSIVARKRIRKNEPFSENNLAVKRPGTGISPMQWDDVIGRLAVRDFDEDELIEL